MDRNEVLAAKEKSLAEELSAWAKDSGVLQPGEKLAFSIRLQRVPLVEAETDCQTAMQDYAYLGRNLFPRACKFRLVRPAEMTDEVAESIIGMMASQRMGMYELLKVHRNNATALAHLDADNVNNRLSNPINGKRYRLYAEWSGVEALKNRGLYHYFQLWEVERR